MTKETYETPYGRSRVRVTRRILSEAQNHRCCYCGGVMHDPREDPLSSARCTIEHIVPRARGGTNAFDNLAAACGGCNSRRSAYEDVDAIAYFHARLQELKAGR